MIVRVVGDGQYEVDDGLMERLNELDREALDALGRDDEASLDRALDEMAAAVRERGTRLPDDALSPSEVVIPPSDLTLEETRKLVSEQGFLPDPVTSDG
ncbi:MAG: hypothetical protein ICV64_08880 [Thermoleophilia bacterium]|nr:hypothetical protein [Thermoleophilia bacterium]